MKKILIAYLAVFAFAANIYAQDADENVIEMANVRLPQNGSANLAVSLTNPSIDCIGFQFDIKLPNGVSASASSKNLTTRATNVSDTWAIAFKQLDVTNNIWNCIAYNMENAAIDGKNGVVINIVLTADESLSIGTVKEATFTNVVLSTKERAYEPEGGKFNIEIIEPLVLDENSTTDPEATAGVEKFMVKRTIKENTWSTICFPFAMTFDQLKNIFGEDVELARLKTAKNTDPDCYEVTGWDAQENITAIDIKFESIDFTDADEIAVGFEANFPYIIRVTKAINEFEVTAKVEPEEASVEDNNGRTGTKKEIYGTFTGTYHAETVVPENALFLSGNKFWYSTGKTKMKGFRAYLELMENLAAVEGGAKISFFVDDEATSIDGIGYQHVVDGVYDLSGRKIQLENGDLNKLQKGVYIIDGKKVTIK
jgi:hypothetical protein